MKRRGKVFCALATAFVLAIGYFAFLLTHEFPVYDVRRIDGRRVFSKAQLWRSAPATYEGMVFEVFARSGLWITKVAYGPDGSHYAFTLGRTVYEFQALEAPYFELIDEYRYDGRFEDFTFPYSSKPRPRAAP